MFPNAKTLSAAIKTLTSCHVEISKAPEASIAYAKKDGKVTERGQEPLFTKTKATKEKRDWGAILHAAEEGRYDDIPKHVLFNQLATVGRHRLNGLKKRKLPDTTTQHEWYYGGTGTGKSRKAREDNPSAYLKNCNKWWDGYEDHEVVIIEDFDKKHDVLSHHLKIWGDRYPFNAEVKGAGTGNIRPKKIIVTSNYHPGDIWEDERDLDPILRRFKPVHFGEFPPKTPNPTSLKAFANPGSAFADLM